MRIGIIDQFDLPTWQDEVASRDVPNIPLTGANAHVFCLDGGRPCTGADAIFSPITQHGNAVAEVVHDMAPAAELYLLTIFTASDLRAGVEWMAARGITVVNRSESAPFDGPGDGTGPLDQVADEAVSKGMTWFNSAGNAAADGYWRGTWADADHDGWLDFGTAGRPGGRRHRGSPAHRRLRLPPRPPLERLGRRRPPQ